MSRIYLDNAATSFPKPETVYRAVDDYQRTLGTAAGRGSYQDGVEASRIVSRCRQAAAALLGAGDPRQIAFTFNGTDSLNLAIHGLLRAGDHVVTSELEHNSVLRPLRFLQDRLGIAVTRVPPDPLGSVDPEDFRKSLRPETRLMVLSHASNVTGAVQPIHEVARIARATGIPFLVDAAQTAGQWPIDLSATPVDLLACSGHKGLLGPLGTGLLYVRPGLETQLASLRQGGTGSSSEDDRQPEALPDKYESGNHNCPGLAGLEAGLNWLRERTVDAVRSHEQLLTSRLLEGLEQIPGIRTHGPGRDRPRTGVVSLTLANYDPQEAAGILDEHFRIQVRAGLHCAPGAHSGLGTRNDGGTVRLSVGPFTTVGEIDAALEALQRLCE